jgi:hypothetical protein
VLRLNILAHEDWNESIEHDVRNATKSDRSATDDLNFFAATFRPPLVLASPSTVP